MVHLVLDKVEEYSDRRLARHLVSLYLEDRPSSHQDQIIPVETLTKYITYAKTRVHPVLTEAASHALVKAYVSLRKVGQDVRSRNVRITATIRQLESMIRMAEAHARMRYMNDHHGSCLIYLLELFFECFMNGVPYDPSSIVIYYHGLYLCRLSETVNEEDVQEASRLLREAIKESATDPLTGQIDMDLLNTGIGAHVRRYLDDMKQEIRSLLSRMGERGDVKWKAAFHTFHEQSSVV